MSESFLNGRVVLHAGDSRAVLKTMADNSIDSIVTDPPYALVSIVKRFGGKNAAAVKVPENGSGAYARASSGFMGKQWDTGETAFAVEFWQECLRVLKPGGHVVAFSGTRTYHRMACAIEDSGFEIRDMLSYLYGSGFPKSHDVSKGIDRAAGAEREVIGLKAGHGSSSALSRSKQAEHGYRPDGDGYGEYDGTRFAPITAPATASALQWQGWGTALKPACEPICFGRKPLIGTVAQNVLAHGTGAINVDGCRVGDEVRHAAFTSLRWPANILHDGSDEVLAAFPDAPGQQRGVGPQHGTKDSVNVYGDYGPRDQFDPRGDAGSAARFFYTAKADADDRLGSKHPTVKPVDLMQWLCRLVTPKGGVVLDPFAGTGTTGEAAFREGFNAVLIEREEEYQNDIRRRMALVLSGPDERARESIKARLKDAPADHGPLFGGLDTPPRRAGESTECSRTNHRTDGIEVVKAS